MKKLHWKAPVMGQLGEQVMRFPIRLILLFCLFLSCSAVLSLQAQPILVGCIGDINATLDENCGFRVLPETVLTGNFEDADSIAISVDDLPVDYFTGCGIHAYNVELFENDELILTCWGNIIAEDKTAPLLVCPEDTGEAVLLNDMQVLNGTLLGEESPSFDPSIYSCFLDVSPPLEVGDRYYGVHNFNITRSDIFTFVAAADHDGIMALYQGEFFPEDPCRNMIARSDDTYIGSTEDFDPVVPILDPSFRLSLSLSITRSYTLVWTSKTPLTEGDYGVAVFTDGDGRLTNLSKTQVQLATELICLDVEEVALGNTYTFSLHPNGNLILDYDDPFRISEDVRQVFDFTGFPEVSDNCSAMLMTVYDEVEEEGDCGNWIITRHFEVQDRYLSDCTDPPLVSTCTQTIIVRRPTIDDLVFPPFTTTLECDENFPTDGDIGGPEDNPAASYAGFPYLSAALNFYNLDESVCNIGAIYSDEPRVTDCPGSYYFRREWTIIDWCDPANNIVLDQVIRVADFTGPEINFVIPDHNENGEADDPIRFSTAPNSCLANANITPPELSDGNGCSGIGSTVAQINDSEGNYLWSGTLDETIQLAIGDYTLIYCATDQCGNESCVEEQIIVRDEIAPVAVCNDEIIVSIGGGDSQNGDFGTATVSAESLDEGSNDHCSDVSISVRRDDQTDWLDEVLFDCSDVGDSIKIHLLVTDTAANVNTCWITVIPEDKLNPFCTAPAPVSLSCTELPLAFPGDIAQAYADDFAATSTMMSAIFGGPAGTDNCTVDTLIERSPNIQVNDCGWGTITRRFEAWQVRPAGDLNNNGQIDINEVDRSNNSCSQLITITETHDFTIDFPEDTAADCGNPEIPSLITSTDGCDILSSNISDPVIFEATGDECYKYAITYDVINWCVWDGEYDGFTLERMTEDDGEALPVDRSVEGNERPVVHYDDNGLLIDRMHTDREGDSSIPDASPVLPDYGRYIYTQYIKVYDSSAPVIDVLSYGGPTPSCAHLTAGQFGDLDGDCEAQVLINFTVSDDCELFDLDGNLVVQLVSAELDAFAEDTNQDGEIQSNEFTVDHDISGLITNNEDGSFQLNGNFPVIPREMGPGIFHTARILIEDGCGNQTSVYLAFDVLDCKAPAPICINGLTVTLMPQEEGGCAMAIWAQDYIASPVYDCTGQGPEQNEDGLFEVTDYAIYRGLDVEADPDFVPSTDDSGLVLTEADDPSTVLYVYAFDKEGNYDFCETYVLVQIHTTCGGGGNVSGLISTENNEAIPAVEVSISGDLPQTVLTNNDGMYAFENITEGSDLSIIPHLNSNPLNGVTTFDLILISKHILGVDPLSGAYQLIAADVNQSGTVSTLDLIQIRKLILNIIPEFSHSNSWRFISAAYDFPIPADPWHESFPELINVNNFTGDLEADFVGVKIGDVNNSVQLSATNANDRNTKEACPLKVEDKVLLAGKEYRVPVYASSLQDLVGFQATLEVRQAEIAAIEYELLQVENIGLVYQDQGYLTFSWHREPYTQLREGEILFSLIIRPQTNLMVSEVLSLSHRYTPGEAYLKDEVHPLALQFLSSTVTEKPFTLLQNIPNPFSGTTVVEFILPEDGEAILQLDQLTGQTVYRTVIFGIAGKNTLQLGPEQIGASKGVLTYSLTYGSITETRKLVILP